MMSQTNYSAGGDPSRIEMELQDRVARAREEYEQAVAESRRLAAESPDAARTLALQHAATRRYSEALRALSEFVLGYKKQNCA